MTFTTNRFFYNINYIDIFIEFIEKNSLSIAMFFCAKFILVFIKITEVNVDQISSESLE